MLTVSIPDLKPNSQDVSAFYLANIYELFGNPNASHPSIPTALAKPPAFSPPKYAIWVNSLWFLSLAVSLSSATVATLFRNWGVYYIEVTQWPWDTLSKRARTHAIFAKGNPGPYVIWGTTKGPTYLHFSLLLFVIGAAIYLFNINSSVFYAVVWWVGYMAILYGHATVAGFFQSHVLLHTPFSSLALRIYLGISYAVSQICSRVSPLHRFHKNTRWNYRDLIGRYGKGFLNGKHKEAEEIASKPSSEIDALILERLLLAIDEDHALETFFDAIPGFCNSKLTILPLPPQVEEKLRQALDGFLNRTFTSNLVSESDRANRLITCLNAAHAALGLDAVSQILDNIFKGHWNEALQSVEIGCALRRWGHSRDYDPNVQRIVACIISRVRERNDRWTALVKEEFHVPDGVLRDSLAHGDESVLLSILIHVLRQANCADSRSWEILSSLSKFDIRNTLPGMQDEFCTLWTEIAQEARNQGSHSTSAQILREIRHFYVALHQDTDSDAGSFNDQSLSDPLYDFASHRPDSTTHIPVAISGVASLPMPPVVSRDAALRQSALNCNTTLRLAEKTNVITGLPSPPYTSTVSEIGEASQASTTLSPFHSSGSPSSDGSSSEDGVAAVQPDNISVIELPYPLESKRQFLVTARVAPLADFGGTSSIVRSVPTPPPVPVSTPSVTVLDKSSATYDASLFSIPKSLFPASSVNFSSPVYPPLPHVLPSLNAELLTLLNGTSSKGPSNNATLPRLCVHRLIHDGNMSLANAVLQLLVSCPPFLDLLRELGQLMGEGEGGETGGATTPLINATIRFLDEFAYKEKSSLMQPFLLQAPRCNMREDEEKTEMNDAEDRFISRCVVDAMKEKKRFINVRVRSHASILVAFCH